MMQDVTTPDALDAALTAPEAVLLKHGARCPISAAARDALDAFAADHPDVPVYRVEVTNTARCPTPWPTASASATSRRRRSCCAAGARRGTPSTTP
jgi:hypothetical protein